MATCSPSVVTTAPAGWRFVIQQCGDPAAVVMGYEDYQELMTLLEDLEDVRDMLESEGEPARCASTWPSRDSRAPEHQVLLRRRAEKQLDRVLYTDHPRIVEAMLALEDDPRPRGCRKLSDDIWRIRVGDYRVVYRIGGERKEV